MANYLDKLAQIESSNRVYSLNPATNASGLFQITPQTKINLEKAYPELKDFDPFDVDDAYKAAEILTEENVKALKNSGISVTDGNKYVLHFMGSGKGRELIQLSNDKNFANKLASDVFPKEASKNKAIFKGKTVAEVYKTITNKMENVKITPRYFGEKVEMVSPTPRGVTIRKDLPTEVIEQQKEDFTPMDPRPDSDVVPPFKPEPKPESKVEPDALEMIDVPMTSKQRKELADRYREKLGIPTKKGLFGLGYTIPGTRIGFNAGGLSKEEEEEPLKQKIESALLKQAKRRAKERTTDKTNVEKLKDIAKTGAEFIPGVGEAMAVKRVSDAMDEKDYVGAAIETAAGALGVIPVVGDVAGKGLRKVFSRKEIEDASPSWFKETEVSKDIKPEDAQKTQITTTTSTYKKAKEILPEGKTLDFGAGKGVGAKEVGSDTYEPFPNKSFSPTYTDSKSIPSNSYDNITSLNVLNVVKPDVRSDIVQDIGRILKPNGTAIITTRGMDVFGDAKNPVKGILADEPRAVITSTGTYQKGFTPKELKEYIESELGENFEVTNVRDLGKAGVKVKKNLKSANVIETEKKSRSDIFEEMQRGFVDATLEGRKQASQKALNKFAEEGDLKEFKVGERILGKNKSFKITGYSAQGFSEEAMEKQIDQYQKLRKNQIEAGTLPEQPTYMLGEDGRYYRISINVESDDGTKTQLYQDILAHQKKKNLDKFLSGLNLAEGGAVPMEEQMSMFDDGGLMDEGGTVDPVSGNEVPVGSTQKEVRDDIPAQLSEGEFVFPADVVRYIGLEKLMQMRQEAKRGLEMMDKMGQMGNADEAVIPDDIPFELSDLDIEDDPVEMQQGGVAGVSTVPSQVGQRPPFTIGPPTTMPIEPPPPPTPAPVPIAPTYTPATQQEVPTFAPEDMQDVSFPGVVQTPESAPQLVEIVNPTTGERRTINYIPGVTEIPEGFVLASEYDGSAQATSVTPVVGQAQTRSRDNDSETPAEKAKRELDAKRMEMAQSFDFTNPADSPFSSLTGNLKPGQRTNTGYIIGDNGEYLDPLTGEQAFFGLESAKYALNPEDKPKLKETDGGVNQKFLDVFRKQRGEFTSSEQKQLKAAKTQKEKVNVAKKLSSARVTFDKDDDDDKIATKVKKAREKAVKDLSQKQKEEEEADTLAFKKGGLASKPKPKPKKMRSGGLASKK